MVPKSLTRSIIALGVPLIVGQLGVVLQTFADTMMVGQYGTMELSAAGFVNNMFNMVIFFMLGISYSTVPIVGALFGLRNYAGTARTLQESLLVNVCCGGILSLLLLLLYFHLDCLGQPEELLPLIRPYFLVQVVSLPFLGAFNSDF